MEETIKDEIFNEIERLDLRLSSTLRKTKTLFFFLSVFFFLKTNFKKNTNIIFYTVNKFLSYLEKRSGAKIYLLNEHLLLMGNKKAIEKYKQLYPANKETEVGKPQLEMT